MTTVELSAETRGTKWAQDFWSGFSQASRLSLAMTVASFFAMTGFAFWFFSENTITGPTGQYLLRSPSDHAAHASLRALQLSKTPVDRPRFIVLGTSSLAHAIASEVLLTEELVQQTGMEWDVSILTTALQSPLEETALAELAIGPPGGTNPVVVATGVNMLKQSWTKQRIFDTDAEPRLGIRSVWADDILKDLGGMPRSRTGIYAIDNYRFVVINGFESLLRFALQKPAMRKLDVFASNKHVNVQPDARDAIVEKIRRGLSDSSTYHFVAEALLKRLSTRPDMRVLQLEEPISPDFLQSENLMGDYIRTNQQFAQWGTQNNAPYLALLDNLPLSGNDFGDIVHIVDSNAQKRIRETLARDVARRIKAGWLQ